jgi:hypothetical protein
MRSATSIRYMLGFFVLSILCLTYTNYYKISISPNYSFNSHCFEWRSNPNQSSCPHYKQINSFIWTYDGTGIMKYIQWIITRKLGNIRITRLDENCSISKENDFPVNSITEVFTQIYIMPLLTDLTVNSKCSITINQTLNINRGQINQIYFTRKSYKATLTFEQLDLIKQNFNTEISSKHIEILKYIFQRFVTYFNIKWTIVYSEDLIHSDLLECEKLLTDFLSLLGLKTSNEKIKNIIQYDSHHFIEDATWWDQSQVAEDMFDKSKASRPTSITYSNDFYRLYGDNSFAHYLSDNRQCYNQGIFPRLPSEILANHSTDNPDRCLTKAYDCAFSDIYSFNDREEFYQESKYKPIKCGFAIPTAFDVIRNRYGRNHTCQTIVFTLITHCYDPLPVLQGTMHPSFCFVALLDTQTINGFKKFYEKDSTGTSKWDVIDLGSNASPFSNAPKSVETLKTLAPRLFPLAKWIVWLDGKANVVSINEILLEARAPFMGAPHDDNKRTSFSEIIPTIDRLRRREKSLTDQFNKTVRDITIQEKQYTLEGFYTRSDALGLKMFDIAIIIYRNNHPCMFRYLCAWHNELNYFAHRGQLSVFYPAVRLNLTSYFQYIQQKHFFIFDHKLVC